MDFIAENWSSLLLIVIFVVIVIVLIYKKQYAILKSIAFSLVTEAEKKFGGGTGAAKFAAVVDWIYPKIPAVVRFFITSKQLTKLIEDGLAEAKKKWGSNPDLKAYISTAKE